MPLNRAIQTAYVLFYRKTVVKDGLAGAGAVKRCLVEAGGKGVMQRSGGLRSEGGVAQGAVCLRGIARGSVRRGGGAVRHGGQW